MKRLKLKLPSVCLIVFCALLLARGANQASAQAAPGHVHPAYGQAISHVREAIVMLRGGDYQNPVHKQVATQAEQDLEAALADLQRAATSDDKNAAAAAGPGNTNISSADRFHKVYDLIKQAHAHASGPESDPMALHARESALKHLDEAEAALSKVMQT